MTTSNTKDGILDDKSEHCIPFILSHLRAHREAHNGEGSTPPFFVGGNGVQGAGKTTLVEALHHTLHAEPHNLRICVLSIDDLYLPRDAQSALAAAHPENPLIQHRGQPGTHDLRLGLSLFRDLRERQPTRLPSYDKAAYHGAGDRDEGRWLTINNKEDETVDVVIFEGWCVGFRPLSDQALEAEWRGAVAAVQREGPEGDKSQLGRQELSSVLFVNDALRGYNGLTDALDAFVHVDAQETQWVYAWRLEQEQKLREARGTGMSDDAVRRFVDGYYPAYELYTKTLRAGIFSEGGSTRGRQLRLVVGRDRKVVEVIVI